MNDGFYFLKNFVFFINFKFWPGSGSVFSNRLDPDPDPHSDSVNTDPKHWYTNTNSFWFSWKYLGEGALVVLDSPAEDPHFVRMEDAVLLGPVLRCHLNTQEDREDACLSGHWHGLSRSHSNAHEQIPRITCRLHVGL